MKTSSLIVGVVAVVLIIGAAVFLSTRDNNRSPSNGTGNQEPLNQRQGTMENQETKKASDQMTFFLTSRNPGKGADLGGLQGADQFCQALANEAGVGNKTWRAYLSAQATGGTQAVNARDRIGNGPWRNFNGEIIANNVDELHSNNKLNKDTALSEKGAMINGRGDQPNLHDILTGSQPDGRAIAGEADSTCGNWTKSGEGAAMVGHHDRKGLQEDEPSRSWNSSHLSRGCSLEALAGSGGGGLFYCFATN